MLSVMGQLIANYRQQEAAYEACRQASIMDVMRRQQLNWLRELQELRARPSYKRKSLVPTIAVA